VLGSHNQVRHVPGNVRDCANDEKRADTVTSCERWRADIAERIQLICVDHIMVHLDSVSWGPRRSWLSRADLQEQIAWSLSPPLPAFEAAGQIFARILGWRLDAFGRIASSVSLI
jgi:hypothetical protein